MMASNDNSCEEHQGWMSLRSVNYPDRYIRHKNFELWLDKIDFLDKLAIKDTTWKLSYSRPILINSVNLPEQAVRH